VNSSIQNINGICTSRGIASLEDVGRVILTLSIRNDPAAESLLTQFLNSSLRNSPDEQMTSISEAMGRVYNSSSDMSLKNTIRRYVTLRTRNLKETVTYGQLMLLHSTLAYNILPADAPIEFGNQVDFDPFQIDANNFHLSPLAWVGIACAIFGCLIGLVFWYRHRFFRMHGMVCEVPLQAPNTDDKSQQSFGKYVSESSRNSIVVEVILNGPTIDARNGMSLETPRTDIAIKPSAIL
jgi:hypothetical protein